ncbi:MAG: hypothetical protein EA400_02630 [Chromatiaceae bacterium]|nr:MAG: hypothetical protein EA400_02630 [Chromatiaceae bacterium]
MSPDPARPPAVLLLFFASGLAGLLFQVLWLRELALLFGNTAQAAAATLAAFFLGLAAGGWFWGRRSSDLRQPLRAYGLLEAGVAASALLFLLLLGLFHLSYRLLYAHLGAAPGLLLAVKLGLALLLLFPPTFCMGGTLPVLTRHLVHGPWRLGRRLPLLYGINTLGAAVGVLLAAFVLPQVLGYRLSYLVAVAITAAIALSALRLATASGATTPVPALQTPAPAGLLTPGLTPGPPLAPGLIRALAVLSGFVTLALEVLWTRMFAQVLQNSSYTFASVLLVFLLALGSGALLAGWLARRPLPPAPTLAIMLTLGALLAATTPLIFMQITNGLGYLGPGADWSGYLAAVLGSTALTLFPAVLVLGLVFPYLAHVSEPHSRAHGRTIGDLVALNTLGAIAGSLAAGFLLLDWLGLWAAIRLLAGLCLAAVPLLLMPSRRAAADGRWLWLPSLGLVLLLSVLDSSRLPVVRVDPLRRQEALYQVWEGSTGTVAVVRRGDDLRLKVNNYYTLGGTGGRAYEARQGHLPLLLHPDPRRVFFLGLGTGITAGAALDHPVQAVTVAELLPEAITAAERYFRPYTNGLFDDPRVTLLATDGRHHLAATRAVYDVIIGELFIPWRAGVGGLYSREHFRAVRARLAPGGLFAQWLPLYQLSAAEFASIARTFSEVFPRTTLWRGDFLPDGPIVALVGHADETPLAPPRTLPGLEGRDLRGNPALTGAPPLLLYYAGNLTQAAELFAAAPSNTDANGFIELRAPITQRRQAAGRVDWLRNEALLALFEAVAAAAPFADDPYLAGLPAGQRQAALAGLALFRSRLAERRGDPETATAAVAEARALLEAAAEVPAAD